MLSNTTATPEQVEAAAALNATARLLALKAAFLMLAALALLAVVPSFGLPRYKPGDVPLPREHR